eukprot:gene11150-7933_t
MRQADNQGLPQYKAAFDAALDEIRTRVDAQFMPDGEAQANQFIMSLDPARFADLQVTFRNKVLSCPDTLEDAYLVASEWVIVPRQSPGNKSITGHAAFHIQTAAHAFITKSHDPKNQKDKKREDKRDKPKEKEAEKQKDKKIIPKTPCRACGQKHFKRFLEQQSAEGAMVTQSSTGVIEDEDDNDAMLTEYAKQFKTNSVQFNLVVNEVRVSESVLIAGQDLSGNTVLLDNQATKGVFGNTKLLSNIRSIRTSTTFSGVGGTIKTNQVGFFKPMQLWVHVAEGLGFNVLSFSEVEQKHNINYVRKEAFHVTTRKGDVYSFNKRDSGLWA